MQLAGAVEHRVSTGRSDVRVLTAGVGSPAVLFDSPLGTPLEAWSLVAPPLAERTSVILWDRPGIGGSGPSHTLDAQSIADAMASVIDEVAEGRVVAVGHSRGGINVLALAACHPELVAGLVLVEPSHPAQLTRLPSADGSLLRVVRLLGRAPTPLARLPAVAARAVVRRAGERVGPRGRVLAELAVAVTGRLDGFTAEHDAGPALLADVGEKLAGRGLPDVPLTVLTGDQNFSDPADQAIWAAMHEELAALADGGKHVHVAAGHGIPLTHPDVVIDAIGDVLGELSHPPD